MSLIHPLDGFHLDSLGKINNNFLVVLGLNLGLCVCLVNTLSAELCSSYFLLKFVFKKGLTFLSRLASHLNPSISTSLVPGIIGMNNHIQLVFLRQDLTNFLPRLTSNHNTPISTF
jgi:hypothetical protein